MCLESLASLKDVLAEVIVVDDTSDIPIDSAFDVPLAAAVRRIRQTSREGYIVARNRIMREAATDTVLLMDDDAALLDAASITEALAVMREHQQIGAVAFAMADRHGAPWPVTMQAAPVDYACTVPAFIGFAHLLRRALFLELGGYREAFEFYGEEKDYCLRLLNAGFSVAYLPHARVAHMPDPSGRDQSRYARYAIRNDCMFAIFNEPFPLPVISVPVRLARFRAMSRGTNDRGGLTWIVRQLARRLPATLADRRAVSWSTLREWRRLARTRPPLHAAQG